MDLLLYVEGIPEDEENGGIYFNPNELHVIFHNVENCLTMEIGNNTWKVEAGSFSLAYARTTEISAKGQILVQSLNLIK